MCVELHIISSSRLPAFRENTYIHLHSLHDLINLINLIWFILRCSVLLDFIVFRSRHWKKTYRDLSQGQRLDFQACIWESIWCICSAQIGKAGTNVEYMIDICIIYKLEVLVWAMEGSDLPFGPSICRYTWSPFETGRLCCNALSGDEEGRRWQGAAWTVALCSFGMTDWRHLRQDMKEKSAARSDRAKIAEKVPHVEPPQPTPVEEARPRQPPSTCPFGNHGKGRGQGQNCFVQVVTFQGVQDRSSCQVSGGVSNGALEEHNPMVWCCRCSFLWFLRILADRFITVNYIKIFSA